MISVEMKAKIIPILKRHGVLKASVFGSFAAGLEREESDLDLKIELPEGKSYFDLLDLEFELSDTLGRPVDLLTSGVKLHPIVQQSIQQEQIPLY